MSALVHRGALLIALSSCLSACPAPGNPGSVRITHGVIVGGPIRIVGPGFELRTGIPFRPPFQSSCYNRARLDTGRLATDPASSFDVGEALGARPVRVHDESTGEAMYGLLLLCDRMSTAQLPHAASYALTLPEGIGDGLAEDGVGVVYERQHWYEMAAAGLGWRWVKNDWFAWILWVSREPIFERGSGAT